MTNLAFAQQLEFIIQHRHADEVVVLAEAVRTGLQTLYWETLIEAYLLGQVPREQALKELGAERLAEVEYQRDALKRDVAWGLQRD